LSALETLGVPEWASVHLDRGYDSKATRRLLEDRGLVGLISEKGKPSALGATKRWVIERTNSWSNAHKKLVWCTERRGRVIDFWVAFSNAIIIVGRLIRKPGVATVGRVGPHADRDLLAQALSHP
jgi:hypothetical protein